MFRNYLKFVLDQFLQHKVRFVLTVSGIVVGVSTLAVLASFLTVGKGVLRQTAFRASGDDLMTIANDWRVSRRFPDERKLSHEDNRALKRSVTLSNVEFSPEYGRDQMTYVFDSREGKGIVMGITREAFTANMLALKQGREFLSTEYLDYSRVAVIGSDLLGKRAGPWVGRSIVVGGYTLRIVGVLAQKPTIGPGDDWSWNKRILLPAETYNVLFNPARVPDSVVGRVSLGDPEITLKESLLAAQQLVVQVMMLPRQIKNFRISGAEDRDSNEQTILMVIQVLMISTTIFSMIVGGINIMNIMLVTVNERTREIGLRRAMGASRNDIMVQFLIESVLITMTGAVVGLVLSLGGLVLLSEVLTRIYYPWPFYIAWWSVALGIGLTAVIGVVFGLSPALKASRLSPVEALRTE